MSYSLEDLNIGMKECIANIITDDMLRAFSDVSGDINPIHLDDEYAKNSIFKERVAHGILLGSFISAVLGSKLPGNNTIYLSQDLEFLAPVKIGDEVLTHVEVIDIIAAKSRVCLKTECFVGDKLVVRGKAVVMVPRK